MKLTVAYSPCPNDTFMFHDLALGRIGLPGREIETHLYDVETLNRMALDAVFDVTKLSFHAYLLAPKVYDLLSVGAALGFGCGPLVVANRRIERAELAGLRVAAPGGLTTAHLLLRLWAPEVREFVFARYDEIMPMVAEGRADVGVIIHEGRFVYREAGLRLIVDLGEWWEAETGLPIPLGGIVARRSLGRETICEFEALLRRGIENSFARPEGTWDYVKAHAREMDEAVLREHIRTFVNAYSLDLGETGRAAVAKLKELALRAGIIG